MTPDFVCIGAPKCGTTWLFDALSGHPALWMPDFKELNYHRPRRDGAMTGDLLGLARYEDAFAAALPGRVVGDISPGLLGGGALCASGLAADARDARLIVMLRHPVERAWSHYQMVVGRSRTNVTLEDLLAGAPDVDSILSDGCYGEHLAAWYELFPADRILCILHDDLKADAVATYRRVCDYLGIDGTIVPEAVTGRSNVNAGYRVLGAHRALMRVAQWMERSGLGAVRRSIKRTGLPDAVRRANVVRRGTPPLSAELAKALAERYADDIDACARLTGRDLAMWKVAP